MWGQIVGGAVAGVIGGEYNKQAQRDNANANAQAAQAAAAEGRAARKEAPDDAMAFFDKVAPDSSQSERLRVSGNAVGQAMSAPTQQAIARSAQRTQANQQQSQFGIQKAQIAQNAVQQTVDNTLKSKQIATQDKIAERNATTSTVNAMVANGHSVKDSLDMADAINKRADRDSQESFKTNSPHSQSKLKSEKTDRERKRIQSVIEADGLSLKEMAHAKDWTLSKNAWEALSKAGISKQAIRQHILDIQNNSNKSERKFNAK